MGEKGRVLIVDDNPSIVRLIEVNLEYEGYDTLLAYDGQHALEVLRDHFPDLVILDLLMPHLDGWGVLSAMKKDPRTSSIPVIMLTAMSQKENLKRGWEMGVEEYLTKPFNPSRLIQAVEKALGKARKEARPVFPFKAGARVAIAGGGEGAMRILQSLLGNAKVAVVGVADSQEDSQVMALARSLGITTSANPYDLATLPSLDLIIECEPGLFERHRLRDLLPPGVEVLTGYAAGFVWGLLEEKETGEERATQLARELYTLYGAAKTVGSVIDLQSTARSTLDSMLDAVGAPEGLLLIQAEEKGTVLNERGERMHLLPEGTEALLSWMLRQPGPRVLPSQQGEIAAFFQDQLSGSLCFFPLSSKGRDRGGVLLLLSGGRTLVEGELALLSALSSHAAIALDNAVMYEQVMKREKLVQQLLGKVIAAQEEERKRISAEIHDGVAQSLVGTLTMVQTCQILLARGETGSAADGLEDLRKVLVDAMKEIRQIIFNLRPSSLDDLGLIPTLENYLKKFESETGTLIDFQVANRERNLPPSVETAIYRIVQEALSNIKRHAKAKRVAIELGIGAQILSLVVSDDGRGFNLDAVKERGIRGDSLGLSGMQERVSLLGGSFEVRSEVGKGTTLKVQVPIKEG